MHVRVLIGASAKSGADTGTMIAIALLILIRYAATTSIAQVRVSDTRPTITQHQQQQQQQAPPPLPTIHLYRETTAENDEGDEAADEFESSASEMVQVHALPETLDSDDSKGGDSGAGFQRARRRRRRRRRKRPKTTPSPGSVTSADTVAPANGRLDLYHTLPEDEIRKKPSKYRTSVDSATMDAALPPQVAEAYDDDEAYTRRRATKRRRRPYKKPPPVDHFTPLAFGGNDHDHDNGDNVEMDNDTASPSLQSTSQYQYDNDDTLAAAKRPHSFKPTATATATTTTTTTTTTTLPPFEQDDVHSPKFDIATTQEESDNSLKKRKTLTATAAQKPQQHHRNDGKDVRHELPQHSKQHQSQSQSQPQPQPQPYPQSVQQNVVEQHSKLVENRKELFKMRRLPPTWAILGQSKQRPFSSLSAATKNETNSDKGATIDQTSPPSQDGTRNKAVVEAQADADDTRSSVSAITSPTSTVSSHRPHENANSTAANPALRSDDERERERVTASTFKPKSKDVEEKTPPPPPPPSTTKRTLAADETEDDEETTQKQKQKRKQEQRNSIDGGATPFQFPIIAYTGPRQAVDSNTSAFLSANDQRLAIIYVPCNQTADKVLPSGGSGAAFVHSSDQSLPTKPNRIANVNVNWPESTTALPDVGQSSSPFVDTVLIGAAGFAGKTKSSSTAKPTTSLWSPSPSLSTIVEKFATDANANANLVSASTSTYTNREAKRYHDATVSKAKFESAKEEQTSSLTRKTYSPAAAAPNAAFVKPFTGSSREIVISYTSTTNSPPSLFSYHNIDSADEQLSLRLNNNNNNNNSGTLPYRKSLEGSALINRNRQQLQQQQQQPPQPHVERKKLPLAVKSAIIISGAVLALAVLGFFALLLSCKIRQAKSRMKCHRELYRDQFQSSEFRRSSRSTSPVMSKSNFSTRNLANNIQPSNAVASNRNYYLWQTLRKTFQYD